MGRVDVSLWYLANHLGRRFLSAARAIVGDLEELASGVWRARVWQRPLLLVSNRAVERDSLPVHLLTAEPQATQQEVVRVLGAHPELWRLYAIWLASLHPAIVEEVTRMGRARDEVPTLDVRPLVQHLGWQEILRQTGLEDLIAQVGLQSLIAQIGWENLIAHGGLENLITHLNAEQRQEALRLLQQTPPPEPRRRRRS
jgi:hypothetical protein